MDVRTERIHLLDLHHTGNYEANTEVIRRYHMDVRGYGDIGYNMVIEPDGTVGIGRDVKWAGAHDLGTAPGGGSMNHVSFGLSHIGNFEEKEMPEVQFQSSVREAVKLCQKYPIPASSNGIRRHKDQFVTACPGKLFPYARYVNEVFKRLHPPQPIPNPDPVKASQWMTVTANPSLNVRSGGGTSYPIIGSLKKGTKVKIGFIKNGWANIYFGDHGGFVSAQYLK